MSATTASPIHYGHTTKVGWLVARFRPGCSCGWKGVGTWLSGDDAFEEAYVHACNANTRATPDPDRVALAAVRALCDAVEADERDGTPEEDAYRAAIGEVRSAMTGIHPRSHRPQSRRKRT